MHYIVKLCKYIYLRRRKTAGAAQLVAFFLHPLGHLFCAQLLDGLPLVALPCCRLRLCYWHPVSCWSWSPCLGRFKIQGQKKPLHGEGV